MRLTRRDVVAALTATGIVVSSVEVGRWLSDRSRGAGRLSRAETSTLVALAEVVYPSEIDGIDRFVEGYVRGRIDADTDRVDGIRDSITYLDAYALSWEDEAFADLGAGARDQLLEAMAADAVEPDPDGSDVERVRYFLIDELLFALYSTPTGGELIGIENPPGFPGGLDSYRQGPRP